MFYIFFHFCYLFSFPPRITVEYGDVTGFAGQTSTYVAECSLTRGEYIQSITAFENTYGPSYNRVTVVRGIAFTTNTGKYCGRYGNNGTPVTVSGKRLLYIEGQKGSKFDRLEFYFEECDD